MRDDDIEPTLPARLRLESRLRAVAASFALASCACGGDPGEGDREVRAEPSASPRASSAPAGSPVGPTHPPEPATAPSLPVAPPAPTTTQPATADPPPGIVVPASVKGAATRRPFVLVLHGFGGSGAALANHLRLPALAEAKAFSYAAPDGALDRSKRRHWNTGPACCDFDQLGTDHVALLRATIEAAKADPAVDPARIYVAGYSNGGFMAERLACDVPGIAGVLDVAGGAPADVGACRAPPVGALLHVHGDADPTVRIEGGRVLGRSDVAPHPAAADAVAAWAKRAGCTAAASSGTLDLEASIEGAETTRSKHQGCSGAFELLTVAGGGHDVAGSPAAFAQLLTLLLAEGS